MNIKFFQMKISIILWYVQKYIHTYIHICFLTLHHQSKHYRIPSNIIGGSTYIPSSVLELQPPNNVSIPSHAIRANLWWLLLKHDVWGIAPLNIGNHGQPTGPTAKSNITATVDYSSDYGGRSVGNVNICKAKNVLIIISTCMYVCMYVIVCMCVYCPIGFLFLIYLKIFWS